LEKGMGRKGHGIGGGADDKPGQRRNWRKFFPVATQGA